MIKRKTAARVLAVASGLSLVGITGIGTASANDQDVIVTGSCSGASDWKLKLSPENGSIESEFEVDSNVVGQVWKVRITDNGTLVFKGTKTTVAPSGSFEARSISADKAGADVFTALAKNPTTGETCRAQATF